MSKRSWTIAARWTQRGMALLLLLTMGRMALASEASSTAPSWTGDQRRTLDALVSGFAKARTVAPAEVAVSATETAPVESPKPAAPAVMDIPTHLERPSVKAAPTEPAAAEPTVQPTPKSTVEPQSTAPVVTSEAWKPAPSRIPAVEIPTRAQRIENGAYQPSKPAEPAQRETMAGDVTGLRRVTYTTEQPLASKEAAPAVQLAPAKVATEKAPSTLEVSDVPRNPLR